MANVFTPRLPSGGRVTFDMSRVQFVTPIPRRKGGSGVVSIDGKEYTVNAASCGLSCYCDAVLIGWTSEVSNA